MRNSLLLASFLWVGAAQAAAPLAYLAPMVLAQSDDDEDADAPAATPTSPTPVATPAAATPAPPPVVAPVAESAPANPDQQRLVSGAPLFNPNVAVHIVEKKEHSDSGKREIVLYPVAMQVNGKFTQHFGTMASFVWHLQENFGLMLTGGYNWYNSESAFNGELVEKFRVEAQAATSLLWTWGAMGGVEVTPLYAKFSFFEGTLAHFSMVVSGGAGVGGTRHQLKPESIRNDGTLSTSTYGDTGIRFMGTLGIGFRLQLGERFAFRLEVRDVVYTARMERVNGCNADDLRAMDTRLKAGSQDLAQDYAAGRLNVGDTCKVDTFSGADSDGNRRSNDVPLAYNLVRTPSSDVLNNIGLYLGVSFLF